MPMIRIDGAMGEGGGQVLRTALTLSVMTQRNLHITNIRAGRRKPGLRPQHLKAVEAAAAICDAGVEGAKIGSNEIKLQPGEIQPNSYHFDIGTAGSTSLVLQTIFLPLSRADKSSQVTVTGGTHVPWSPCFHYLDWQWLQTMGLIGFDADLSMSKAGFYPQGGGQIQAVIRPAKHISGLSLMYRGQVKQVRGISGVANLPRQIAERQRNRVVKRVGHKYPLNDVRIVNLPSKFKGTTLVLLAEFENSQACYFGLGALGKPAERVADEAIKELGAFIETNGAIDQYLADQILLPLAFAEGESEFRTSQITQHLVTNADVIRRFLAVEITIDGQIGESGSIRISPQ